MFCIQFTRPPNFGDLVVTSNENHRIIHLFKIIEKSNECKFNHPKICYKFNQFGPKVGINKGYDEKCGFFHLIAFQKFSKDRTCSYAEYNGRETSPTTVREWKEDSKTKSGNCCFVIYAARIWNQITPDIKAAPTLYQAKKVTKKYFYYYY